MLSRWPGWQLAHLRLAGPRIDHGQGTENQLSQFRTFAY